MLGASRDHHKVSSFDILVLASYCGFADTGGESQGLVDGMNLIEPAINLCTAALGRMKRAMKKQGPTSSPISPSTGTVMSTTCEYKPVQSTLRNSPDLDGRAEVISGK